MRKLILALALLTAAGGQAVAVDTQPLDHAEAAVERRERCMETQPFDGWNHFPRAKHGYRP